MLRQVGILVILLSSTAMAKTSAELLAHGQYTKSLHSIQKEILKASDEEVEILLNRSLEILSRSSDDKSAAVMNIYQSTHKKKIRPYLVQRVTADLKVLPDWNVIKKWKVEELRKKIDEAEKMKDALLMPNIEKRSLLKIYSHIAQWHNFRRKDPRWMLAHAKAQYALSKGGLSILKEIRSLENLPNDIKADVEWMIEDQD